uniref:Uncharacterized protein n=1 Tax=Anguilla anguilla TaxID=7936 RepID=A0A0E9XR93_ANGAN
MYNFYYKRSWFFGWRLTFLSVWFVIEEVIIATMIKYLISTYSND